MGEAGTRVRGQSGFLLVEAMVTVVLMGLALVGLLASMTVALRSTQLQTELVQGGLSTTQASDQLQQATYVPCATSGAAIASTSYDSAITAKAGYAITIEQIKYLADRTSATPVYDATCPAVDQGAQQMVVVVKAANTKVRARLTIVKRDNRCPAAFPTVADQKC